MPDIPDCPKEAPTTRVKTVPIDGPAAAYYAHGYYNGTLAPWTDGALPFDPAAVAAYAAGYADVRRQGTGSPLMRYAQERLGWPPGGVPINDVPRCGAPRPGQNPCLNTPKPGESRCVKHGGAPGKHWKPDYGRTNRR